LNGLTLDWRLQSRRDDQSQPPPTKSHKRLKTRKGGCCFCSCGFNRQASWVQVVGLMLMFNRASTQNFIPHPSSFILYPFF